MRRWVASALQERLTPQAEHAANAVARFWKERSYRAVFPLRYGRAVGTSSYARGGALYEGAQVQLSDAAVRRNFLEGMNHPPLLTAHTDPNLLIADHHLAVAALLNAGLRRLGVDAPILHPVRLGALVHELSDLVDLSAHPFAQAVASYLNGTGECPQPLRDLAGGS